jgi:hypothetical protein
MVREILRKVPYVIQHMQDLFFMKFLLTLFRSINRKFGELTRYRSTKIALYIILL